MFRLTHIIALMILVAIPAIQAEAQTEYIDGPILDTDYIQTSNYEMPTVKFTFDGYLFTRVGGDESQPLLLESVGPAPASLTSGDLDFQGRLGGRAELVFFAKPHRLSPRASVIWTGTELSKGERSGSPADINFFNAFAADPSDMYTARNKSRFIFADIGLRRGVSPAYGFSASVAYAKIVESLDLISAPEPMGVTPAMGTTGESGFFSQVENELFGVQLGADAQLWSNGYSKIEANVTAGIFHNDITVGAQAQNAEQLWDSSDTSFIGTANISLVIPADPVNFRIGYQGALLTGIALPASQSRDRSIIHGTGDDPKDDVWYHGLLFGVELVR